MIVSREGGSVGMLALLPAMFVPLMNRAAAKEHSIFLVPLALLFIIFLVMAIYQHRTPLMKIENDSLVYYGIAPWERKSYALAGIARVKLFSSSNFWRSARLLAIETDAGIHRIWLPGSPWTSNPMHQLREMLQSQFKERYAEVTS